MTSLPGTIPQVLDRIADQFSEHAALVTPDRRLTFAELRDEVRRAAAAMVDMGVQAGDRVAIWSPNTWHWVVACLATTYAGGVLVPLNTRYTATEAVDILARTGAPLLFASGDFLGADKAASIDRDTVPDLRHIVRVPIEKNDGTWDEFMGGGPFAGNRLATYRAQSPISSAANIRTPTLIMSNTGDFRVPITQAFKLFHALKDNQVETQFIAYPMTGHNASDPVRQRDVQRRWMEWLDEHFRSADNTALR